MHGAFNQYFSDSLSERTQYRMRAAVKAGRFVWRAPIGYVNSKSGAGSTINPDLKRAPLVRKGFELMATGSYHADDVLRSITALGLRTMKDMPLPRQTMARHASQLHFTQVGLRRGRNHSAWRTSIHCQPRTVRQGAVRSGRSLEDGAAPTAVELGVPVASVRAMCEDAGKGLTGGIAKKKFPVLLVLPEGLP